MCSETFCSLPGLLESKFVSFEFLMQPTESVNNEKRRAESSISNLHLNHVYDESHSGSHVSHVYDFVDIFFPLFAFFCV